MAKPPKTPPHSDIDGVREDEASVIDRANAAGQDAGDVDRARKKSIGRPPASDEAVVKRDDRR